MPDPVITDGPAPQGLAPNVRGALWMVASALGFTAMTTLIKYLGDDYPAALQTFYRQAAGLIILLPVILRNPRGVYRTTRPGILLFRSAAGTLGMILSFYGFQHMPLADANALSFTRTLWLVPLAAFIVGETLGVNRIVAALVGFGGVLIMVRPGAEGFALGWPALAMLASSFLFALTITGMKVMTRDHSPTTLLVWAATLGFFFGIPGALFTWRWPAPAWWWPRPSTSPGANSSWPSGACWNRRRLRRPAPPEDQRKRPPANQRALPYSPQEQGCPIPRRSAPAGRRGP